MAQPPDSDLFAHYRQRAQDRPQDFEFPDSYYDATRVQKTFDDAAEALEAVAESFPETPLERAARHLVETGTDTGHAHRLERLHGEDLRYVPEWARWLVFDSRRFREDSRESGRALGRTLDLAGSFRHDAATAAADEEPKEAKTFQALATRVEAASKMREALCVLRVFPALQVETTALNSNPWLLNCRNGTLDLKTGTLRPHDRRDLITQLVPVDFDPEALCPLWDDFLATVQPDEGMREYLQQIAGTTLLGLAHEVPVLVLFGTGANGKSVFVEVLRGALGDDYSVSLPAAAITSLRARADEQERSLVPIVDKRLTTVLEIGEGRSLNEAIVKSLVSGEPVPIRRLYSEQAETVPRGTLILTSNHRLNVAGTDDGIWRRVREVPFDVQIEESLRDPGLRQRILAEEAPGVLAWMYRGFQAWGRSGQLEEPEPVTAATATYREEQDDIGAFFLECCLEGRGESCPSRRLRAAYVFWCEQQGEKPISPKRVGARLRRRGFEAGKSHGKRIWRGFDVRPEFSAEAERKG